MFDGAIFDSAIFDVTAVVPPPPPVIPPGGAGSFLHGWNTQWQRPSGKKRKKKKAPIVVVAPVETPKPKPIFKPITLEEIFPNLASVRDTAPAKSLNEIMANIQKSELTHTNNRQKALKAKRQRR